MTYFFRSLATFSFWRFALFSKAAVGSLLSAIGVQYLILEILDFFSIYQKAAYARYAVIPFVLIALIYVIVTRRPMLRISYRPSQRDYKVEVKIADLFEEPGDVVISTSTTFDTSIEDGLISANSLQGQLALRVFQGNTAEIDRQIGLALTGVISTPRPDAPGKKAEYPIGTVAKVSLPGKIFYFVAMSRLNQHGTARSTLRDIEDALSGLWQSVGERGELRTLAIPVMGTGRGRIDVPRKKMIERIAQSFADASREKVFSNRLVIVVEPRDADAFGVNLFEVRDYLTRSLHI